MEGYSHFNRGSLPSDSEAAALISTFSAPPSAVGVAEAFVLLSRWARQLSQRQQHSPGERITTATQQETLTAAVHAAIETLLNCASVSDLPGAAAILLLGNASAAFSGTLGTKSIEEVAEVVGASLLAAQEPLQQTHVAIEYLISGVAALLPSLSYNADATCWIFTALLRYLGTVRTPTQEMTKSFASLYPAMRTAATSIINTSLPAASSGGGGGSSYQQRCLNSMYGALRAALLPQNVYMNILSTNGMGESGLNSRETTSTLATAATLAAGGMLEALARYHQQRPIPALIPLIEALAELLQHCDNISVTQNYGDTSLHIAAAIAIAQTYQSCRLPRPTPSTLQCCLGALLDTVLNIKPLLHVLTYSSNGSSAPAGPLSAALAQQAHEKGWTVYAAALQSTALTQLSQVRLSSEQLDTVLNTIKHAAERTHEQYRQYILQFWTQERAQVAYRPLQSLLEKNFLASIELLAAATLSSNLASSSRIGKNTLKASTVLCIIANLQFCRGNTSNPHYTLLLKDALQSLPLDLSSSSSAITEVLHCLPAYTELEALVPAHGNAPAWRVDALSASKVQLLFTALASCSLKNLPEELALDILAPLAFLYLLYPHSGTSAAAHTVLWSLMGAKAHYAEQLTPYYVTRCLEKIRIHLSSQSSFPSSSFASSASSVGSSSVEQDQLQHLHQFSQGLSTALATIPPGSPLGLLTVEKILASCLQLVVAGHCWDDLCVALFNVASQQMLTVDYTLVDAVSRQLQEFIVNCPAAERFRLKSRLSEEVLKLVIGTEDCVRKPRLATWYQNMSASFTQSCL
jgi:hypothetical protein